MREIKRVVLHHTASAEGVLTWEDIRRIHVEDNGWRDIGYHAGVVRSGPDFDVVNGRMFELPGAHAKGANADSLGVVFEGNFEIELPHRRQIEVGVALVASLCFRYAIDPLAHIVGHRDVGTTATVCPGRWFPLDEIRGRVADRMRWL